MLIVMVIVQLQSKSFMCCALPKKLESFWRCNRQSKPSSILFQYNTWYDFDSSQYLRYSAIPHLGVLFNYCLRSFAMSLREKHFIDYSAENRWFAFWWKFDFFALKQRAAENVWLVSCWVIIVFLAGGFHCPSSFHYYY